MNDLEGKLGQLSVIQNFLSGSHSRPVSSDGQMTRHQYHLFAYILKSVEIVIGLKRWSYCRLCQFSFLSSVVWGSTCCKTYEFNRRKKDFFKVSRTKWSSDDV